MRFIIKRIQALLQFGYNFFPEMDRSCDPGSRRDNSYRGILFIIVSGKWQVDSLGMENSAGWLIQSYKKIVRVDTPPERLMEVEKVLFYLKRNNTSGDISPSLNKTNMLRQVCLYVFGVFQLNNQLPLPR